MLSIEVFFSKLLKNISFIMLTAIGIKLQNNVNQTFTMYVHCKYFYNRLGYKC